MKIGVFAPADYRIAIDAPFERGAEVGRQLARVLLPPEIWRLLGETWPVFLHAATSACACVSAWMTT